MTIAEPGAHRVVWILDALQPGGAERLALRFAATAPAPWEVRLVALRPPRGGEELAQLWGSELGATAQAARQLGMWGLGDVGNWLRLVGELRAWRPEIVHTHLRYATIWGAAAARWLGVPQVTTVHLVPGPEPSRRQRWAARLERACRQRAARVIYVSQAQRQAWEEVWGKAARSEPAVVIGNGVAGGGQPRRERAAADISQLRQERGLPADAWVLITVAVVRARKGWRTWLEVVEKMAPARPQALFGWVEGGPEFNLLERAAAASPWARQVRLLGPRTDVGAWLELSDVFLFPSEEEAQPTAVMEAMAAGLAVVATDLPAIAEVLGACGRLVPVGDAAAMAAAVLAWTAAGAEAERRQWGERARRRAQTCYSERAWREQVLSLYTEVLNERDPARAEHSDGRVFRPGRTAAL